MTIPYLHKQIQWTLDLITGKHQCRHIDGVYQTFNLTRLLPDGLWEKLSEVAKRAFANGVAQKLGDLGAGFSYTPEEKRDVFTERWDMMKAGQWNLPGLTSEEAKARRKQRVAEATMGKKLLEAYPDELLQALVDKPVEGIPVEYVKAEIARRASE